MSGNVHRRKLRMALERMNSVADLGRAAAAGDGVDWEDHPESESCILYDSSAVSSADEMPCPSCRACHLQKGGSASI